MSQDTKAWFIAQERKVIASGSVTTLFKYVNKKMGRSRHIPPLLVNNRKISDDLEKAEALNSIFTNNFVHDNNDIPILPVNINGPRCDSIEISLSCVKRKLSALKNSYSVGPDGFSAFFLQNVEY